MSRIRILLPGLLAAAAILAAPLGCVPGFIGTAHAQEGGAVRPEVGNPLKAAGALIKAGKARDALAKIGEADAVSGKTANESFLINQMRFSAASMAGEADTAAKALDALTSSGRLPAGEQAKFAESLAGAYYRAKDYPKAIQWAQRTLKDNPGNTQARMLLAQSYYVNNECGKAIPELQGMVQGESQSGRPPTEAQLDMLASCYSKQKDNAGALLVLEKQLTYYPTREHWSDALTRVQRKPGYSSRLDVDIFRLKYVNNLVRTPAEYMEMGQLLLQAGAPAEAKKVVDQAFASGALGTGPEADRHKRLRDLATKTYNEAQQAAAQREADAAASPDGQALVNLGFEYVAEGKTDKGLQLIDTGIKKGGMKNVEEAKLRLGEAQYMAGHKNRALEAFKTVKGNEGTADLARLWILQSGRSS
jgi:tetratricopeptide (TPR) repeat protein